MKIKNTNQQSNSIIESLQEEVFSKKIINLALNVKQEDCLNYLNGMILVIKERIRRLKRQDDDYYFELFHQVKIFNIIEEAKYNIELFKFPN